MQLSFSIGKKHIFIALCLILLSACKQSEFYEKAGLSEITTPGGGNGGGFTPGENPNPPIDPGPTDPTDPTDPTEPTTPTDPTNPGGGGCTSNCGGGVVTPPVDPGPTTPTNPTNPEVVLNDRVEHFTQNTEKKGDVDILWVIDDSGSMADEQDALARNFQLFINQFLEKDVNFKMAITTTDASSARNGKMVGDSSLLTSEAAKANKKTFLSNFTKWVKVGISGSGTERGLQTSVSFMNRYASSFLRDDAFLVVVYISDEEDQSTSKAMTYLESLQKYKGNKALVKAYSIVVADTKNLNSWETVGHRYMEVSQASAGSIGSIKEDFASILLDMGGKIVNLIDSFALNEQPYENQVEVLVNGNKVTTGFVFDAAQRTVKFNENSLPQEGSKIEVRYKVKASVLGAI